MRRSFLVSTRRVVAWMLLVTLCAALSGVRADSVTLQSVSDTTLFEQSPANNLGAVTTLASGTTAGDIVNPGGVSSRSRALIRFEPVGQFSPIATVTSVTLTVRVTRTSVVGGVDSTFHLHKVLQSWGEGNKGVGTGTGVGQAATDGEATWNARHHPSGLWSMPGTAAGADYVTEPSAAVFIAGIADYTFASTPKLVADVQSWLDNTNSNFGWILISQDEGTPTTARRFGSRESGTNAPVLTIDYRTTDATPPPKIDLIQLSATNVNIRFTVQPTLVIALEYADSLPSTNWITLTNLGAKVTPITVNCPDSILTDLRRFYRLEQTGGIR